MCFKVIEKRTHTFVKKQKKRGKIPRKSPITSAKDLLKCSWTERKLQSCLKLRNSQNRIRHETFFR